MGMGTREIRVPSAAEFGDEDFLEAGNLLLLAEDLMRHWPEMAFLAEFRGRVFWRRKGALSGGRQVYAKCQLASGLLRFLGDTDWIVTVAADFARTGERDGDWFEALMYHELAGIEQVTDEDGDAVEPPQLRTKGHEFEGYLSEIKRYGAWDVRLEAARRMFEQPVLPGFAGKAEDRVGYIRAGADADFKEVVAQAFEANGATVDRETGEIRLASGTTAKIRIASGTTATFGRVAAAVAPAADAGHVAEAGETAPEFDGEVDEVVAHGGDDTRVAAVTA